MLEWIDGHVFIHFKSTNTPIHQDCTYPRMDDDDHAPATENITTLEFYRSLNHACTAESCTLNFPAGSESYWDLVLETPDLERQEENSTWQEESLFNDTAEFNLSEADLAVLLNTDNSSQRRLNTLKFVTAKSIQRDFGIGSNGFSYDFEAGNVYLSEVPLGVFVSFSSSGRGSFSAAASVAGVTATVTLKCGGEASGWRLQSWSPLMQSQSSYSGKLTLSLSGSVFVIVGSARVTIAGGSLLRCSCP